MMKPITIRHFARAALIAALVSTAAACGGKGDPFEYDTDTGTGADGVSCAVIDPCGDHGTCSDAGGQITCACDTGYAGTYCNQCASGYHWDGAACSQNESCTPDPCVNGACAVVGGKAVCACDHGWAGDLCDTCAPGFHDEGGECVLDQQCLPTSCANGGTCDDTGGVVTCTCPPESNWDPDTFCHECIAGHHPDGGVCVEDEVCADTTCNGKGSCEVVNGKAVCTCEAANTVMPYCECVTGFNDHGDTCDMGCALWGVDCGVHGTCIDTGVSAHCVCAQGYAGIDCGACAPGFHQNPETTLLNCLPNQSCGDPHPCGDHGTCDDGTGVIVCTCDEGWAGEFCDECAAGFHEHDGACVLDTVCGPNTCSGNEVENGCDDTGGQITCTCKPEYDGTYCQDCAENHHWEGNECVPDETCDPDPCHRGECSEVDGKAVCACAYGWAGELCDTCAPGFHPEGTECVLDVTCLPSTCSFREVSCTAVNGDITCVCLPAYAGDYCELCADDHHFDGGVCLPDESCTADTCNGNGACEVVNGKAVCTCTPGWAGQYCHTCAPGFHPEGDDCVLDQTCLDSTCSYAGTCSDAGGEISCSCSTGYAGTYCENCAGGYHRDGGLCILNETCTDTTCSGNGSCEVVGGKAVCSCNYGWAGAACNTCAVGFHLEGGNCVLDYTCQPNSCSGKEDSCSADGGEITCVCQTGYTGNYCQSCATGFHRDGDDCIPNESCTPNPCVSGECEVIGGKRVCDCDDGWAGEFCNTCAPGFHQEGDDCVLDQVCLDSTCSYAGTCSDAGGEISCSCSTGYAGTYCQDCAGGYHRDGGLCILNETCTPSPCVNGTCEVVGGKAVCTCDYGWAGATCEDCAPGFHPEGGNCVLDETCHDSTCSYGGTCSIVGGKVSCACSTGYTGTYCQSCAAGFHRDGDVCVPNEVCEPDSCSYAGECVVVGGKVVCSCDTGYAGPTCAYCQDGFQDNDGDGICRLDCALANPPCDQGSCSDASGHAVCVCNTGWSGSLCATCIDDSLEPNNSTLQATLISAPYTNNSLVLCRNNEDWFAINLIAGHEITVTLNHINANGNIDIYLYREYPFNVVAWSTTTNNIEQMTHLVNVGEAGKYFIRVRTPSSGFRRNTYSLNVTLTSTTCLTCEELGVDCGVWDNGCGLIDCTAMLCYEDEDYCEQHLGDGVGNCAQYFDDLIYGCCDGNILNIVDYGYSFNCAGIGAVCSWVTDTWSSGGETYSGYFWCVPPASYEPTPPHLEACPDGMDWAP